MNTVIYLLWLLTFLCLTKTHLCLRSVTLNGKWIAHNSNGSISVSARVPGSIYTDLLNGGILHDPYYRNNSVNYRWVAYENWTFRRSIQLSAEILQHHVIQLVMEGLDTIATVSVNGHVVEKTDNMFRRYVVDVKDILQVGNNELEVAFQSPVLYARRQASNYPYDVPEVCPPLVQQGECYFNFIRKEACSFSWDWGPAFPTSGIWRNISLEAYNSTMIRYVTTETYKGLEDTSWTLNGSVYFDVGLQKSTVSGEVHISIPDIFSYTDQIIVDLKSTVYNFSVNIPKAKILPWWPNGVGVPTLYDLHVTFKSALAMEEIDMSLRIGFRTVELVQTVLPQSAGLTFFFKINSVPVFMKGSNWVPADSFQERISHAYLHRLLQSAVDANMNMLRVWGGGVYESDVFYNLADELGILLWQDFMFACTLYPTDQAFLTNVQSEVIHQIRRLKHHPSIALWAGNNENEEELNHYRGQHVWKQYYQDYVTLNINLVRQIALTEDPLRPFALSSPSNGLETLHEGWVSKFPKDPRYGDSHHYNYPADSWDHSVYPVPRFVSEYGRQSWCSFEAYSAVSLPKDWEIFSNMTEQRNHRDHGNVNMLSEVARHFILPTSKNLTTRFIDYIFLTQINHAIGMKTETELYRRRQSCLDASGLGLTSGALYWQLNDIWQAPTWASIEYGGKWKMLHYFSRWFFNKILVSPYLEDDILIVYYIDDDIRHDSKSTSTEAAVNSEMQKSPTDKDGMLHVFVGDTDKKKSTLQEKSTNELEKPMVLNRIDDQHGYFSLHGDKQYLDKIRTHSETVNMQGSQWKDNSASSKQQLTLHIQCFHWKFLKPIHSWNKTFSKPQLPSSEVARMNMTSLLVNCQCSGREQCLLYFSVEEPARDTATNWLLLSDFTTAAGLHKTVLKVSNITQVDTQMLSFTLTTDAIAPFVWLDTQGITGRFSDNGFIMVEPVKVLSFYAWDKPIYIDEFHRCLTVKSLMDMYK